MSPSRVAPWQVWWCDFDPQVGREQAGQRPAIVVGTQISCRMPNGLVLLVPCSTRDRGLAHHVPVTIGGRPSVALTDHIKSVSEDRLQRRAAGGLLPDEIAAVKAALRRLIDLA